MRARQPRTIHDSGSPPHAPGGLGLPLPKPLRAFTGDVLSAKAEITKALVVQFAQRGALLRALHPDKNPFREQPRRRTSDGQGPQHRRGTTENWRVGHGGPRQGQRTAMRSLVDVLLPLRMARHRW